MSPAEQQSALPMLTAHSRGGEALFQAHVNAYVVGNQRERMWGGKCYARPLYWVSLVAMRGQSTTLQGLFAKLVSTSMREVSISDLGDVHLAHHADALASLSYSLHWNFEQTEVLPSRDLHAVIESRQLTCVDPVRGMANRKRGGGGGGGEKGGQTPPTKGKSAAGRASLSTAKGSAMQLGVSEMQARETHPAFLLLVREKGERARERGHLAFLDQRVPWPLMEAWASFLWGRGISTGEIEPLTVWCYPTHVEPKGPPEEEDQETHAEPRQVEAIIQSAYLCRPNPAKLLQDLQLALAEGELELPREVKRAVSRPLELVAC